MITVEGYIRTILRPRNGKLALNSFNHLKALGLSKARITKYASHLIALLKTIDFNLEKATKKMLKKL